MSTLAVISEAREFVAADPPKVVLDSALARRVVDTEPESVSGCAARDPLEVRVSFIDIFLGYGSGGGKRQPIARSAAGVGIPLVVGAGDCETTGELDFSNILNSRVEVLECATNINVGEEVRRFDGVISSTRSSEIIRGGHWR